MYRFDLSKTIYILAAIVVSTALFAFEHDVEDIIAKQDELYRSGNSYSKMEMHMVTPHWERTLELEVWSKGMDMTFILINSPKKEKGMATLRVENEMWNYLPKTDKIMKIPPSMMMSSWMGSDFTNDDLVKESSLKEDYRYKIIHPEEALEDLIYVELIPKEETASVWGRIVISVRESDYLPVDERFFDEKGELMRIIDFKEITMLGGREIPTVMELIPLNKEGNKTVMRYSEAKFDIVLDDEVFTLRNLRKKR
jgi:outer membrane lipoprotein-sorting protein